jgi:hypothetical protein
MNKNKVVHSLRRKIIYNVYKFMRQEAERTPTSKTAVIQKVASATGVSISTVKRICKEGASDPGLYYEFLTTSDDYNYVFFV